MVLVGVLALQGSFSEHIVVLKRCGASAVEIRTADELHACDALIIPGGESTTMAHVANKTGMLEALREFVIRDGKPVWGTCAGLIFLAQTAEGADSHAGACTAVTLHERMHAQGYKRSIAYPNSL